MRLAEIGSLTVADVARLPVITWTGKGRKPRQMTAGERLVDAIRRYLAEYDEPQPDDPLICRQVMGAARQGGPAASTGTTLRNPARSTGSSTSAGRRLASGHVAPHDLRRSAAGILHRAVNADGAHHFDLLDIQRVLGHSDPATTMKSYLEPMDTAVLDRAAGFLD